MQLVIVLQKDITATPLDQILFFLCSTSFFIVAIPAECLFHFFHCIPIIPLQDGQHQPHDALYPKELALHHVSEKADGDSQLFKYTLVWDGF